MDPNYNPFLETFQQGPEETAVPTGNQRYVKLARKGLSLGYTDRDIEARTIPESLTELAGSMPTVMGVTAALGPVVGPAAGALRLGTVGARVLTAAGTGGIIGGAESLAKGENALEGAAKGAVSWGALEGAGVVGGKVFTKLTGIGGKAAETAGETVDKVITKATETPSPAAVDALTTKVPDVPQIKAYRQPEQMTIGGLGEPTYPPQQPLFNLEKYGPKISATARDTGTENVDRVPFQSFVQEVTPLWQPVRNVPLGPGLVADAEATKIRAELAQRFPAKILESAQTMEAADFAKYASEPTVNAIISEAGTNPTALWRAVQLTQSAAGASEKQFAISTGSQPFFQEIFDETLGKKVLVPINPQADLAIQAMKLLPSPRQLALQLEPEQLSFLQGVEGRGLLRKMDIVKRNEPLLTSNVLKKSEKEVADIVKNAEGMVITQPTVLDMSKNGTEALQLRRQMGIKDNELDRMVKESKVATEVAETPGVKSPGAPLTLADIQAKLAAKLLENCK